MAIHDATPGHGRWLVPTLLLAVSGAPLTAVAAPGEATPAEEPSAPPAEAEPEAEEPAAEEPSEEVPLEEVPLEEVPPPKAPPREVPPEAGTVRVLRVSADPFGSGGHDEIFRHAAGRSTVDRGEIQQRGAASFSEALSKLPGVRSLEGLSGVGSTSTKLNVGVRGASPDLSENATVLLDEIPLAMAPYGQPELSLFPVSLFALDRIDAVRGGVSVRFGPQTSGGVFNLMTKPIPRTPEAAVSTRVDQFGHALMAAGFGTTVDRFGVYAEYAPQAGKSFRANSNVQVHSGLLKLAYDPGPRVSIASTSHAYWEESGVPGGLTRAAYEEDRFGTIRPGDVFGGWRAGEAIKLGVRRREDRHFQLFSYYNHSQRSTRLTDLRTLDGQPTVRRIERIYDTVGLEPRHALRMGREGGPFVDMTMGMRGTLELAQLGGSEVARDNPAMLSAYSDADARVGALAAYVEQSHHLLDDSLVLEGGIRTELIRLTRRDNLRTGSQGVISETAFGVVPSLSLWWSPRDEVSTFVAYARSFAPPTFTQLGAALNAQDFLRAETVDTVELGLRVEEVVGLYGESTAWFRSFRDMQDIGLETVEWVGDAWAAGLETEIEWAPGELWDSLTGSEVFAGHTYTRSIIHRSLNYLGKELPWYPRHEVWAGLGYALPWSCSFMRGVEGNDDCRAVTVGGDVEWSASQYSNFAGTVVEPYFASVGLIPAYTLVDAYARFRVLLPRYWALNLTVGVKNALDAEWFYRTDDINEGLLPQRPRTFYVTIDVKHWFFDAQARAGERRDARRAERRQRRSLQP